MSPALVGGFFTTEPPGKPQGNFLPLGLPCLHDATTPNPEAISPEDLGPREQHEAISWAYMSQ